MIKHNIGMSDTHFIIGHVGENKAHEFLFDISEWIEDFGQGTPSLLIQRPNEDYSYPVIINFENNCVSWIVTELEVNKPGKGSIQLSYLIDGQIVKSKVYSITIKSSIAGQTGQIPESEKPWVDKVVEAGEQAIKAATIVPKIIGDKWYVYNTGIKDYVSTGVKAQGEPGYTPIKGIDYYTQQDKEELINEIVKILNQ